MSMRQCNNIERIDNTNKILQGSFVSRVLLFFRHGYLTTRLVPKTKVVVMTHLGPLRALPSNSTSSIGQWFYSSPRFEPRDIELLFSRAQSGD